MKLRSGRKRVSIGLTLMVAAVALSTPALAASQLPGTGVITVNSGEAGVNLGATAAQAQAAWGAPYSCGHHTCFYEDYQTSERAWISFGVSSGQATSLTTTVSGWKTPAGIHVGSTRAALLAAYGSQLNTSACGGANWPCILGTYGGVNVATVFQLISGTIANIRIADR